MSEAEVQPETPETPAAPEKPKRKPAKAKPAEAQPEVVVTVSAPALPTADEVRAAVESAAAHNVARFPPAAPVRDPAPFRAYKARHPHWGALHCAIHDGCLDDDGVARARQDARMQRDAEAVALADLLAAMSEPERRALREVLR